MHTGGDPDGEAQDGYQDDDEVLQEEEELANAAVEVPEGEHLDEGGEGEAHGGQAEGADERDEQLEVGDGHGEEDWKQGTVNTLKV